MCNNTDPNKCAYITSFFLEITLNEAGCSANPECATPGANCSSGICMCPKTTFYDGTICMESKYIGLPVLYFCSKFIKYNDANKKSITEIRYLLKKSLLYETIISV